MDLPVCPSCGQSVIDDDVTDCPFCGSSLSGDPSSPPRPEPPASTAVDNSNVTAIRSRVVKGDSSNEDEDPFVITDPSVKNAIPATPKPSKGRLLRVVCPMCDTAGFLPKKAAGSDVRCANPECLVPVFAAPASQPKPKPAEDDTRGQSPRSMIPWIIGLVIVAGGVGIGAVLLIKTLESDRRGPLVSAAVRPAGEDVDEVSDPDAAPVSPNSDDSATTEGATGPGIPDVDPDELIEETLELMVDTARSSDSNRDKPWCRRLTADAFAHRGRLKQAGLELRQLRRIDSDKIEYRILPLCTIAWRRMESGKPEAACDILLRLGLASAESLPSHGINTLESAITLAASLVAVGERDAATQLLNKHRRDRHEQRLNAEIASRLVVMRETLLANQPDIEWSPIRVSDDPLQVGVVVMLTLRGRIVEARDFAIRTPVADVRIDCLAAMAEIIARTSQTGNVERVERLFALTADGSAERARVLAAAACGYSAANADDVASELLQRAVDTLGAVPAAPHAGMPAMAEVQDWQRPDIRTLKVAATASAEIARAAATTSDATAAAVGLARLLEFTSAMSPPQVQVDQRRRDAQSAGTSKLTAQLGAALGIERRDRLRAAVSNYRRRLAALARAAANRSKVEFELLNAAIRAGLDQETADLIDKAGADDRQSMLATDLPWYLIDALRRTGADDAAEQLEQELDDRSPDPEVRGFLEAARRLEADPATSVGSVLDETAMLIGSRRLRVILDLQRSLLQSADPETRIAFIKSLENDLWREWLLDPLACRAAMTEPIGYVRQLIDEASLPATERVAAYHGLVLGTLLLQGGDSEAATAAEDGDAHAGN